MTNADRYTKIADALKAFEKENGGTVADDVTFESFTKWLKEDFFTPEMLFDDVKWFVGMYPYSDGDSPCYVRSCDINVLRDAIKAYEKAKKRNCDAMGVTGIVNAHKAFCRRTGNCGKCKHYVPNGRPGECLLRFALAPYAESKNDGGRNEDA